LRLGFVAPEFFKFPKWFQFLNGFGNQSGGSFLIFARLRFVMLPDTLRFLLHLGELLVNELLRFDNRSLRLLLHRCNFLVSRILSFSHGRLRFVFCAERIVFQTFVFYEKKDCESQCERKKNGEKNNHGDGLVCRIVSLAGGLNSAILDFNSSRIFLMLASKSWKPMSATEF
jgi:hypothetical protein